jgi:hypothetical protein
MTDMSSVANQEAVIQRYIGPERRREFESAIRAPQNFLKHADKGPHAVLDFDPHANELLLLIEIETFRPFTGGITDAMNVFLTYAAATWGKDPFEAVPLGTCWRDLPRLLHKRRSESFSRFAWKSSHGAAMRSEAL